MEAKIYDKGGRLEYGVDSDRPYQPLETVQIGSIGQWDSEGVVAEEKPIALIYNGISYAVMMGTPSNLKDFALGFSLSESIIMTRSECQDIEIEESDSGVQIHITITNRRIFALKDKRRNITGRTGCGLCGIESLAEAVKTPQQLSPPPLPTYQAVKNAVGELKHKQEYQRNAGGFHAAAWCDQTGKVTRIREDIGRHNALDKLIGSIDKIDTQLGFVLISSRISYELVQKVATCGIGILVALSVPTTLAINIARRANIHIIGLAKNDRLVLYSTWLK
ncbi:formate dehydrogenase accessory sulfurtransferase FdhD [Photobacterium makurazakiensis]|uniref:formate dehydrogenase accessory sulfurtransferase FdhD n=1 Tax=Photobacterium makurazakiensis TaxID=2910234 RepID=UPI003D0FA02C